MAGRRRRRSDCGVLAAEAAWSRIIVPLLSGNHRQRAGCLQVKARCQLVGGRGWVSAVTTLVRWRAILGHESSSGMSPKNWAIGGVRTSESELHHTAVGGGGCRAAIAAAPTPWPIPLRLPAGSDRHRATAVPACCPGRSCGGRSWRRRPLAAANYRGGYGGGDRGYGGDYRGGYAAMAAMAAYDRGWGWPWAVRSMTGTGQAALPDTAARK